MVERGDRAKVATDAIAAGAIEVPAVRARLWLAWSPRGLTTAHWSSAGLTIAQALGADHPPETEVPEPYRGVLQRYFAGEPVEPTSLPVDLHGTPFQLRVWQALRTIPRGQVRSYASIARDVGSARAMRAVGGANGKNPVAVVVPCHRVVEADMTLGGYSGGVEYKRYLLTLEGSQLVGDRVQPGQLDLLGS
jgi:O-6-methylguanine DNA methyltransferase